MKASETYRPSGLDGGIDGGRVSYLSQRDGMRYVYLNAINELRHVDVVGVPIEKVRAEDLHAFAGAINRLGQMHLRYKEEA